VKKFILNQRTILFSTILSVFIIGMVTPSAYAAEGDIVSVITCDDGLSSVGLAFDGTTLYYLKGGFAAYDRLGTCDTDGVEGADIPISGESDVISTIAYDASRDLLWAATIELPGEERDIYQINKNTGVATFQFTAIATSIGTLTDGLAYDGQDDSIWITGDVSSVISHYRTDGTVIGIDLPVPALAGGQHAISGVAAGVDVLYLGHNGIPVISKHLKSDLSKLAEFSTGVGRTEDLECDPDTFPGIDVVWSTDLGTPILEAFEVADGTCPLGGGGAVGGEILPINSMALMLAGVQSISMWMIPVVVSGAGIGVFVIMRTRK
jgi:hypothetical protein